VPFALPSQSLITVSAFLRTLGLFLSLDFSHVLVSRGELDGPPLQLATLEYGCTG